MSGCSISGEVLSGLSVSLSLTSVAYLPSGMPMSVPLCLLGWSLTLGWN